MKTATIAIADHPECDYEKWKAAPTYKRRKGRIVSRIFAVTPIVYAADTPKDLLGTGYSLTHRPTGFSAGHFDTISHAVKAARALTKLTGAKAWEFTDPMTVKSAPFKQCKQIISEHGGW